MDLETFVNLRPNLYHLTSRINLPHILAGRSISPANALFESAGVPSMKRTHRKNPEHIVIAGTRIHVRDQSPLYEKNMLLSQPWGFADYIHYLNKHVFFWPGMADKPIDYGLRHFARYRDDDCVVLRFDTASLIAENTNTTTGPLVTRFNSGSPRWSGGKPSPRGPDTFCPISRYEGTRGSVVELVFCGDVRFQSAAPDILEINKY